MEGQFERKCKYERYTDSDEIMKPRETRISSSNFAYDFYWFSKNLSKFEAKCDDAGFRILLLEPIAVK